MSQAALVIDAPTRDLYERDVVAWAAEQARLMRDRRFDLVDWDHVIEEVEDVGDRYRDELESRLSTLIEHWLKLLLSPAEEPRAGWRRTMRRLVTRIERLLERHPSLRTPVIYAELVAEARASAVKDAAVELIDRFEVKSVAEVRDTAREIPDASLLDEAAWPER